MFPYTNSYQAENWATKEAELSRLRVLGTLVFLLLVYEFSPIEMRYFLLCCKNDQIYVLMKYFPRFRAIGINASLD